MSYPDTCVVTFGPVNPLLSQWLKETGFAMVREGMQWTRYSGTSSPTIARNREISQFLSTTDLPWLLSVDGDAIPLNGATDTLLQSSFDIAGCRCADRMSYEEAHSPEGHICFTMARISRKALEEMGPPWFWWQISANGMNLEKCGCVTFCEKAQAKGFHPMKVGRVGHLVNPEIIIIQDNGSVVVERVTDPKWRTKLRGSVPGPRSFFSARIGVCRKCNNWERERCKLRPDCTKCYLARPGAVCPDTPPKWSPFSLVRTG